MKEIIEKKVKVIWEDGTRTQIREGKVALKKEVQYIPKIKSIPLKESKLVRSKYD